MPRVKQNISGKKCLCLFFISILLPLFMGLPFPLLSGRAHAAQVTLAWEANTEMDLQAYKVYSGTASRTYSCSTNVGRSTTCTIGDLAAGTTYYFAVTALDTAGNESGYSNEVRYTVPASAPPSSQPRELVISQTPYTSWSLGFKNTRMLYAQSFKAIGPGIESVTVALAKYRSPTMPVQISIRQASPAGSTLASGQILPSQVASTDYRNPSWIKVTFSSPLPVTPGATYFLVLEVSTGNYRNYYRVPLGKDSYADGIAYQSAVTQRSDVDILSKIVFTD